MPGAFPCFSLECEPHLKTGWIPCIPMGHPKSRGCSVGGEFERRTLSLLAVRWWVHLSFFFIYKLEIIEPTLPYLPRWED